MLSSLQSAKLLHNVFFLIVSVILSYGYLNVGLQEKESFIRFSTETNTSPLIGAVHHPRPAPLFILICSAGRQVIHF